MPPPHLRQAATAFAAIATISTAPAQPDIPAQNASAPEAFAIGQLWVSGGQQFVVQDRFTLPEFGPCVAVRITGRKTLRDLNFVGREDLRITLQSVYPESILRRWAERKISTLPAELIAAWPSTQWLSSFRQGRVNLRTVSPSRWSQERTRYVQEAIRFLPSVKAANIQDLTSDCKARRLRIEIITVKPGKRAGKRLENHEVIYRMNGQNFASRLELLAALAKIAERDTSIAILPDTQTVYGDIAPLVDRLAQFRYRDIVFAEKKDRSPAPAKLPVKLEAGQVWTHRVAKSSKDGRLQILGTTVLPGFGEMVAVRFLDLPAIPDGLGEFFGRDSQVVRGRALRTDLKKRQETQPIPTDDAIDWNTWHADYQAGDDGFSTMRPAHLVDGRRKWANAGEILKDLIPYLPSATDEGERKK